jgi:hypothetical protein
LVEPQFLLLLNLNISPRRSFGILGRVKFGFHCSSPVIVTKKAFSLTSIGFLGSILSGSGLVSAPLTGSVFLVSLKIIPASILTF